MKRTFLFIILSLFLIGFITQVHGDTSPQGMIAQQLGVSTDQINNIPQTPEQAQDLFLKQAWSDLISKNVYLGPVHRFFISISPVFLFLFGENYSLSPTLLAIIVIWCYDVMEVSIIVDSFGFLNSWVSKVIAVGISIILAQVGFYRWLITSLANIVYAPELWWVRLLIGVGIILGLFILHFIVKMFESQMKANKKAARVNKIEDEVKKEEAFIQ